MKRAKCFELVQLGVEDNIGPQSICNNLFLDFTTWQYTRQKSLFSKSMADKI